jgi:basic amino acid/polyamine antiporter, APA family
MFSSDYSCLEYLAWFIGWNSALQNQLGALVVVVNWSKSVTHLLGLISNTQPIARFLEAPFVWDETVDSFRATGQIMNFPSIFITLVITCLLIIGLRPMVMVNSVLVVIKICLLLVFIIACSKFIDRKNYQPFFPPNKGFAFE